MTRLTSDTAFKLILHSSIMPSIDVRIMQIVTTTMTADQRSRPSSRKDMTRMALILVPRFTNASLLIVRYCS